MSHQMQPCKDIFVFLVQRLCSQIMSGETVKKSYNEGYLVALQPVFIVTVPYRKRNRNKNYKLDMKK